MSILTKKSNSWQNRHIFYIPKLYLIQSKKINFQGESPKAKSKVFMPKNY